MAALEISLLGLATAAAAGAISFLSPCVLPLVPGYLSYVAGGAGTTGSSDAVSGFPGKGQGDDQRGFLYPAKQYP